MSETTIINLTGAPASARAAALGGNPKQAAAIHSLWTRRVGIEHTIYLVLRNVSRSGDTAIVQAFYIDETHADLDAVGLQIALALGLEYDQVTAGGGIVIKALSPGAGYNPAAGRMMTDLSVALNGGDELEWEWL